MPEARGTERRMDTFGCCEPGVHCLGCWQRVFPAERRTAAVRRTGRPRGPPSTPWAMALSSSTPNGALRGNFSGLLLLRAERAAVGSGMVPLTPPKTWLSFLGVVNPASRGLYRRCWRSVRAVGGACWTLLARRGALESP